MTYGTILMRSESDMAATKSKRLARRSHKPAKRFESLGGQIDGQEDSQRVRVANWKVQRLAGGSERPTRGSGDNPEDLEGQPGGLGGQPGNLEGQAGGGGKKKVKYRNLETKKQRN